MGCHAFFFFCFCFCFCFCRDSTLFLGVISFQILVLLISATILTSRISTHATTNVSLTLSVAVWVCRLSLRFHISKYLAMRHHYAGTQSFALVFYLYGPLLWGQEAPYVILTKFRTRFIDLLSYSDQQNLQHLRWSSLAVNYCSFKNGTLVLVSSAVIIFLP